MRGRRGACYRGTAAGLTRMFGIAGSGGGSYSGSGEVASCVAGVRPPAVRSSLGARPASRSTRSRTLPGGGGSGACPYNVAGGHRVTASAIEPPESRGSISMQIQGGPGAPFHARSSMVSYFDGQLASAHADEAALIVSELVTNSVIHADVGPSQTLTLDRAILEDRLRITVTDPGLGHVPQLRGRPITTEPRRARAADRRQAVLGVGSHTGQRRANERLVRSPARASLPRASGFRRPTSNHSLPPFGVHWAPWLPVRTSRERTVLGRTRASPSVALAK